MKSAIEQYDIVRRSSRAKQLAKAVRPALFGLFLILAILTSLLYTRGGERAYAAPNNTVNFQARLLSGNGAVAPDGNSYSIQFNLYNVSSGGSSLWTETLSSQTIKNGYLSVSLGSVTPFPNTINWSDELWLTMNVNGDGEMNPRLKLTAVPLAFRAKQADGITNGSSTLTANDLAQLAPGTAQVINSALAALRLNQTGAGGLLQLQNNGNDVFAVNNNGDLTSDGNATFAGGTLNLGDATTSGGLVISDGSNNTATIQSAALSGDKTYILPSIAGSSATICVSTGNCGGTGDISQNGNSFGTAVTIGTNDAYALNFETGGTTQLSIDTSGNVNLANGGLSIGGTTVITNGRALQNVTGTNVDGVSFDANVITGGTLSDSRLSTNVTVQGNTFNGANNLVKLDGSGKFVAIDGSALTNLTAANISGQISVAQGGTGLSSLTTNALLFGNGTGNVQQTNVGTGGQVLLANGLGVPTFTSVSGDISLSSAGLTTIANDAVTTAKILNGNVTNAKLQNSSINLNYGTNLSGDTSVALGGTLNITFSATPTFTTVNTGALNTTGALTFNSFGGTAGLLKVNGAGGVSVSTAGTDYEVPLTFSNGLTRTGNAVTLGGNLTGLTTVGLNSNNFVFGGTGNVGIGTNSTPAARLQINTGADATTGLIIRQNSATQSADLLQLQTSAGGQLVAFQNDGVLDLTAVSGTADSANTGVLGDKITLYSNTSFGRYGFGIQSGTLVTYLGASNAAFAVRVDPASGQASSGATNAFAVTGAGNGAFAGGLAVNGNALTSSSGSFTLLASPTNITAFGAATTLSIGTTAGITTINGNTLTSTGLTFGGAGTTTIQAANNQALTVQSQGSAGLTLTSGNGTIVLGSSTLQRNAASFTFDLSNGASNSVFAFNNSGAGTASLNLQDGDLQTAGTLRLTNGGALQNITGLTITANGINNGSFGITNAGAIGGVAGLTFVSGNLNLANGGIINTGSIAGATNITASGTIQGATINATTTFQLNGTSGRTLNCSSTEGIDDVEIRGGILITSSCRGFGLSDANLKEHVVSLSSDVLNNIRNVNVVNFDFDCTNSIFVQNGGNYRCDDSTQTGVIAQQLEAIFPGLVFTGADGYKRVNYEGLSMYTLKAVQELATIVDADGNVELNTVATGGTVRLTEDGQLQNITGLTIVSGGASITGGIDNNSGGITEAGSISGVTGLTFTSGSLNLNGGGIVNAGTVTGVTGITFSSGNLALAGGNITGGGTITATTFSGALSGNASTATALAADPADCAANQFARAIGASGALTCTAIAANNLPSAAADLGAANVTINLGNTNGSFNTNLILDGTITSGAINGATVASTSFNGVTIGSGAVNGLTISSGALSGVTGITFTSGNLALGGGNISGAGSIGGTSLSLSGGITAATTSTINGININAGALSGISTISASGSVTAATSNTINGLSINSGALSGISTISASGSITASTTGTINGLNINAGALSGITGITSSGNITLNNGTTNTITSTKELVLEQTGDTFGTSRLKLQNRNGAAGALFENTGLDLVDFGFKPNAGPQANLRFEHRSGSLINAGNTSGEFQFLDDATGTMSYTVAFGKAATTINQGNLNVQAGAIQLAGTTLINNNRSLTNVTGITFTSGGLNLAGGGITNGGALSGITTLSLSGAISGATAANTINGLIISSGSLSGITGYNQASGAFTIGGTGAITIGGGSNALTINSSGFDVTSAGAVTANSTVTATGNITTSGIYRQGALNGVTVATCGNTQYLGGMRVSGGIITAADQCRGVGLSDERLKTNIVSLDDSILAKIKQVNTVNFDFDCSNPYWQQSNTRCDTDHQTGVIAQQLAQIFPDLTYKDEYGIYHVKYDALNIYTLKAVQQVDEKVDNLQIKEQQNEVKTGGVVRLDQNGQLQNITGLNMVGGGASVAGGLNNNNGGISNAGSISGVTSIAAESIKLSANVSANMLELKKDDKGVFTVFNNGALQLQLDSGNAFAVKDASGMSIFNIDSQTGKVSLGAGNDNKTVLFVLDKRALPDDPPGELGGSYFNTNMQRFRCYDGKWRDCLPAGDITDPFSLAKVSWNLPAADTEFPDSPRMVSNLDQAHEYRLRLRLLTAAPNGAKCRIQYAPNDSGPWKDLAETDGELAIDATGTLKSNWFSIAKDARHEDMTLRFMCRNGNGQQTVFNGVTMQLR